MKLKLFFSILSIVFATTTIADDYDWHHRTITSTKVSSTPTPCIVGGVSLCPTGSICTQTMTCGGLCQSIFTPPPFNSCIGAGVPGGGAGNCPAGSTCTPTGTCFPEGMRGCDGQCIATPKPLVSCTPGVSSNCPSSSTCAPITTCASGSSCGGQCVQTQGPLPSVPCILGGPSVCGPNSVCTQTETCSGQCLGTFVPPPTTSSTSSCKA